MPHEFRDSDAFIALFGAGKEGSRLNEPAPNHLLEVLAAPTSWAWTRGAGTAQRIEALRTTMKRRGIARGQDFDEPTPGGRDPWKKPSRIQFSQAHPWRLSRTSGARKYPGPNRMTSGSTNLTTRAQEGRPPGGLAASVATGPLLGAARPTRADAPPS
jgi:hypothetical protein